MLIIKHLQRGGYVTPNICYVEENESLVFNPEIIKNNTLQFPVYLVEGDNGQLGIDVYNYLFEKYSDGVHFTEELYFEGTSYSAFDGRIISIISKGSDTLVLFLQNNLNAANIHLNSNGIVRLFIYG